MKYLLPYELNPITGTVLSFVRKKFGCVYDDPSHCVGRVSLYKKNHPENWYNKWVHTYYGSNGGFDTKDAAMKSLDELLISRGYIIIPDNEAERWTKKLKVLL